MGTLRLLEAIRASGVRRRFYQASSSEMFGSAPAAAERADAVPPAQPVRRRQGVRLLVDGQLPRGLRAVRLQRHPVQPRVAATRRDVRDAQDHPGRRADQGRAAGQRCTSGNLDAKRDWGYARDYVEAMWLMLQQDEPDDFVIATGETHTVREFVELAFARVGTGLGTVRPDRPPLPPPLRGRRAARRPVQGVARSSDGGPPRGSRSSSGSWWTATSDSSRTRWPAGSSVSTGSGSRSHDFTCADRRALMRPT